MAIIRLQGLTAAADSWPSIDAAMNVVASAERVSVMNLPEGGIAFEVEPGPRNVWKVPVACAAIGAICLAVGYLLYVYNPGLPDGYVWGMPWKLMGIGAITLAMGPVFLLIFVMQGPPKKSTVEVRLGSLRADRSIGGDRVVSQYSAAEVERLLVDDAALFATTRKGEQALLAHEKRDVKIAIATLLAARLWHGKETAGRAAPELYGWVILPRSERVPADIGAKPRP